MHRRKLLAQLGVLALLALTRKAHSTAHVEPIRIGLTPVFLDDQPGFLRDWQSYLAARLNQPVVFVQRGSYREIIDLILQNKVHFAWLCGFPFVRHRQRIRLLAVPSFRGKPLYQSYLIVPHDDTLTEGVLDLRNRVFAFSDPDSNSGFLYPQYLLRQAGARSETFFRRSFFTYSHRNVVDAVANRLAHGGAVDGYVWETLKLTHPELTRRTRVAHRSQEFGFPPFVVAPGVSTTDTERTRKVLFNMKADPLGKSLLLRLNLDDFVLASPSLFDSIYHMASVLSRTP